MRLVYATIALPLLAWPLCAQEPGERAHADSARPPRGSQFLIPIGSLVLPGLGQYIHRAPRAGLAFTGTAITGAVVSTVGDAWGDTWEGDFPRRGRDQIAEQGSSVLLNAAFLSSWDSFHRAVPALQRQGKYEFLRSRESMGELLSAPLDHRFLKRWTTWVALAETAAITALIISDREPGGVYVPFRANDAAYLTSVSFNAATGEEAVFRGWLLPLFHQNTGRRFWLANGMQAGLFGAAHLPDAGWFAAYIGAWAAWEGWVVRRNDWSIRESIFHHFWYDAAILTATFLTEELQGEVRITFPRIAF